MFLTQRLRTSPRTLALAAVGAAALLISAALPANAAESAPNAAARASGIAERGEASMGWKHRADRSIAVTPQASTTASVEGIDVASHQGNVDWRYWWNKGKRFAYVKATEGNYYKNPYFTQQYNGSYNIGMIRGAYHFATPNDSSGANQANYFVDRGGGWSKDGKTLPGVLDIEYNPYGGTCYGKSDAQMVSWIRDFVSTYKSRTGRDAVIYTTTDWWRTCTGNSSAFGSTNPLWIARYNTSPGTLPAGWGFHTFWQYTDSPLDQDRFNGSMDRLKVLANG